MPTDIKIAIIGAGSATFSAGIVRDLCVNPGLKGSHIAFMDIDSHRLQMVSRLAKRLAYELRAQLTFSQTTDRAEALQGADFVINTAQVGGHTWTETQRQLAEKHGYYRGIRLHDVGQILFFLEVARDIERICPNALLIQSANPVFEGCTAMHRETNIRILGLCHGHYGYRKVAAVLGLELEYITAQMHGFNHWIWMTDFRYKGQDAYPLLDTWIANEAETYWSKGEFQYNDNQMSRAAIYQYQLWGLLPIGDTPRFAGWWFHTDLETKQRWYGSSGGFDSEIGWAQYLERIAKKVTAIEAVARDETQPVCATFKPVQSDEQIVPIINSLVNDEEAIYQVNIPNRGPLIPGFPQNLVIETEGVVNSTGIHGVMPTPLPSKLVVAAMIPRWHQAELVVEAVRQADSDLLLLYILNSHHSRKLEQAEALLMEWLAEPRNEHVRHHFGVRHRKTAMYQPVIHY